MKVPVINAPQLESRPLPTPYLDINAGPGAFGASIAQGASNLGQNIEQITRKRLEDDTKINVNDTTATMSKSITEMLYSTDVDQATQQPKGLLNRKLEAGRNILPEFTDRAKKILEAAEKEAANPLAKRLIHEQGTQHIASVSSTVMQHQANETEQALQFHVARVKDEALSAVKLDAENDTLAKDQTALVIAADRSQYPAGSVSKEDAKTMAEKAESDILAARLEALQADPNKHSKFISLYDRDNKKLRGNNIDKYKELYAKVEDQTDTYKIADDIWDQSKGNEAKAVELLRGVDPTKRAGVTAVVDHRFAQKRSADSAMQQAHLDLAKKEFYGAGGTSIAAISPANRKAVIDDGNGEAIAAMEREAKQKIEGKSVQHTDLASWTTWDAKTDAEKAGPGGDLTQYRDKWTEADWQRAEAYRNELIRAERGFIKKDKTKLTEAEIRNFLNTSFHDVGKMDKYDDYGAPRFKTYESNVRRRIEDFQRANGGKDPDLDEMDRYAAFALVEGKLVDAGPWYARYVDVAKRRYEAIQIERATGVKQNFRTFDEHDLDTDPLDVVTYVPPDAVRKLSDLIRKDGRDPTQAEILARYREYLDLLKNKPSRAEQQSIDTP